MKVTEEPPYYISLSRCIDASKHCSDIKKQFQEFEKEVLKALESLTGWIEISNLCETIYGNFAFFIDQKLEEEILILERLAYSKLYSSLIIELVKADDNYRRWSLWDTIPVSIRPREHLGLQALIFESIKENDPNDEDLEMIETHSQKPTN